MQIEYYIKDDLIGWIAGDGVVYSPKGDLDSIYPTVHQAIRREKEHPTLSREEGQERKTYTIPDPVLTDFKKTETGYQGIDQYGDSVEGDVEVQSFEDRDIVRLGELEKVFYKPIDRVGNIEQALLILMQ